MKGAEVSIVIPARNEESHIAACLDSVFSQDYPQKLIEVIVVDGMSTDRTRDIIHEYARRHPRLKLLDNPGKTAPRAVNAGIRASSGRIIVRLDAHSSYPADYVRRCIELLESTNAGNAGGRVVNVPNGSGPWARPVARATSHRFGVGASAFRTSEKPGFVDTVPFGTFRREIIDELGPFDERLTRGQDYEFNARLRRAGYKIAFDPSIRVEYKNQAALSGLCRQAYFAGMWNVYIARLHPHSLAIRRFVPAAFVLYLAVLLASARLVCGLPLAAYALIALYACADGRYSWAENLRTAATFFCYHVCYGAGLLTGVFNLATGRWRRQLGRPLRP
ncbi:MAG: glycosyltransferase family 2 protein [Elusimicrobia bacterium]|nr:glycosyltransferase family 2 protein [Elusimicrobiota bacterium]